MADFRVTELAEDLDLDAPPSGDAVIIDAAPAELAASLTTARRCVPLHFPRRLAVIDALQPRSVFYNVAKVGDDEGREVAVVGSGDSAFDGAAMARDRRAANKNPRPAVASTT